MLCLTPASSQGRFLAQAVVVPAPVVLGWSWGEAAGKGRLCLLLSPPAAQGSVFKAKQTCSARSFQSRLQAFLPGDVLPSRAPTCVLRSDLALARRPRVVGGSADAVPGRQACAGATGVQAHLPANSGRSRPFVFFFPLSSFMFFEQRSPAVPVCKG